MDAIVKPSQRLKGEIQALSSKNYTTRYMLIAALAEGKSTIHYPAHSEDSDAMRRCLKDLGAQLIETEETMEVQGFGKHPRNVSTLNVGNAGAVLRFLMSVASFLPEVTFVNTYPESLGRRPHDDLIQALTAMNVRINHNQGKLPITLYG
jgi:3-phosphoshikimate 1-carboxyvinyltransferase